MERLLKIALFKLALPHCSPAGLASLAYQEVARL
jgi:hypothetical protein